MTTFYGNGGGVKEFGGEVLDYTNCPFNCVFREWG